MVESPADRLFCRYRGLIHYAAKMYVNQSPVIDLEDLFQDGCLLMLEFFNGRVNTKDDRIHNTFKKSLFLWMRRTVKRRIKQAHPKDKAMVRLNRNGFIEMAQAGDDLEWKCIDLDHMLATVDTCVLAKLYAREFVAELRYLLKGLDLTILDLLVRSVENGDLCADVVKRVVTETGTCAANVYGRMKVIRGMATKILIRSA